MKNVESEALWGNSCYFRDMVRFSGESLSFERTQAHGVSVDQRLMVNSDSVCPVKVYCCIFFFLMRRSWIITLTEEEAFADQRLCCNTQTINNEEKYLGLAVFGQVQGKSKLWV